MKKKHLIIPVIMLMLLSSCTWLGKKYPAISPNVITLPSQGLKVVDGINCLGIDVISKIDDDKYNDNILISPFNMSAVMTLLWQGAQSTTQDNLKKFLYFDGIQDITINRTFQTLMNNLGSVDPEIDFLPANALWITDKVIIQPSFLSTAQNYFNINLFVRPFNNQQLAIMNNWIKDQTHGKIDQYFNNIDTTDLMDAVNAYYFSAAWYDGFDPNNTQDRPFTLKDGQTVNIAMMSDIISQARYMQNDSISMAEIYFGHGNYSMILVVPRDNADIDVITHHLTAQIWNLWLTALSTRQPVEVTIPKLNFRRFYNFQPYFLKLGLGSVFDSTANFSGISPGLHLTKAYENSVIKITETGCNYTGGIIKEHTKPQYKISANRPFLFAIRETTTGVMILLGIIKNPKIE